MEFTQISAATSDDRGYISDILYKSKYSHAAIIETACVPGQRVVRGNHYHKKSTQYIFVVRGCLTYYYQDVEAWQKSPAQSILVPEYGLVFTPAYEIHALEITEPTTFICFSHGLRGGNDYERDTFRVTPPILAM